MTDGDKLRSIAEYLDTIPGGGEMQADLRRIAIDLDRPEPVEWLVVEDQSVRLPDVEYVDVSDGFVLGLVSGRTVAIHVDAEDVDELLAAIHRSRS